MDSPIRTWVNEPERRTDLASRYPGRYVWWDGPDERRQLITTNSSSLVSDKSIVVPVIRYMDDDDSRSIVLWSKHRDILHCRECANPELIVVVSFNQQGRPTRTCGAYNRTPRTVSGIKYIDIASEEWDWYHRVLTTYLEMRNESTLLDRGKVLVLARIKASVGAISEDCCGVLR